MSDDHDTPLTTVRDGELPEVVLQGYVMIGERRRAVNCMLWPPKRVPGEHESWACRVVLSHPSFLDSFVAGDDEDQSRQLAREFVASTIKSLMLGSGGPRVPTDG